MNGERPIALRNKARSTFKIVSTFCSREYFGSNLEPDKVMMVIHINGFLSTMQEKDYMKPDREGDLIAPFFHPLKLPSTPIFSTFYAIGSYFGGKKKTRNELPMYILITK